MGQLLPIAFWACAILAITGTVRLFRPRPPRALFDRTHRAIGWLAALSLGPALVGALVHLVAYPEDVPPLLLIFPMLWFVTLGGGSAVAIAELSGASTTSAGGEAMLAYVTGAITLLLVAIAVVSFRGVQTGQRRVPVPARTLGILVLLNSIVGLVLMLPMLLDD